MGSVVFQMSKSVFSSHFFFKYHHCIFLLESYTTEESYSFIKFVLIYKLMKNTNQMQDFAKLCGVKMKSEFSIFLVQAPGPEVINRLSCSA